MSHHGELVGPEGSAPRVPGREMLPAILDGCHTRTVEERLNRFTLSVAEMLERWIARHRSPHTQRAYRRDLMDFVAFLGIPWPQGAASLFTATVADVHAYRDLLAARRAPKTVNRRIASLSGFFKFLREVAAEMRLPVQVANPAAKEFVARENADPVEERRHFSAAKARQLFSLPGAETVLDYRDRAVLKCLVYTGMRIGTLLGLEVADFRYDDHDPRIRISEKGGKRRTIGLNVLAAHAIREYLEKAEITKGPLFRARLNSRSQKLGSRPMSYPTAYRLLRAYFAQLPGAIKEVDDPENDGQTMRKCVYTPHSTRATTATLLLEAGEDIRKVQELLGHRHVTTTQIYDKRRQQTSEGASHHVPV